MIVALIVGIIALFLTFLYDRKVNNWGFGAAMIILTVFCAIRWEWGTDMPGYALAFDAYGLENVKFWQIKKVGQINILYNESNEILWGVLNVLCQPIGFFGMTIVLSIFEGFTIFWFVKKYVPRGYKTFAVFLYAFNTNMMILGCSMMRQWLAMCIVILAFSFIEKKKYLFYFLVVFLASLFHTSALFCVVFPLFGLLRNVRFNVQNILIFVFFAIVWVYLFGRFTSDIVLQVFSLGRFEQYEAYLTSGRGAASVGFASLMNIVVVALCLYSLNCSSSENKILTLVYSGFVIFLPYEAVLPLASRLLFYFEIFSLSVIPNGYKNNKAFAKWFIILWVVIWYSYMFFRFFNSKPWIYSYLEYHTIFEAPYWR